MSYLVLLRHGNSVANADSRIAGSTDSPLTELGIQEAREAGHKLVDIHFSAGYASTLERAQQTLQEIVTVLGQDIPLIYDAALNERDWGIYEGEPYASLDSDLPQAHVLREWDLRPEKGESYADVALRTVAYIKREILPRVLAGENILMVTHNGNVRTIQQYFENIPTIEAYKYRMGNCEIKIYDIDPSGIILNSTTR